MTFKVGDRVKTKTKEPHYNDLLGVIVSVDDDGDLIVDTPNYPYLPFNPKELEVTPTETPKITSEFEYEVTRIVNGVRDTLIAKNEAYGNSALEPVRVFSTSDPVEQLRVRIDDKLSRLKSSAADNEDTVLDLMGYLVLLRIATRKQDDK